MPIDTEQWRAHTGLFCASRVLLRPPRCKQPHPKVQADTLSLNMKFSMAVLLVTLRTVICYASRTLQLLWLITCDASWLLSLIVRLSCRRLRGVSVLLALCLVVVQMLLIMSGDVEENPGPPKIQTTSLGVGDLSCVREELLDVSRKWFDIGLKLKLSVGTLECVRDQYTDPSTALREMLLHWLKMVDPPPTWEGLACALESRTVGEPRLAEQLRTKHCKTEGAAGGLKRQKLETVSSKERPPQHPGHARAVPPSQRFKPSTTSHIPRPIAWREVCAGSLKRETLQTVSAKERPPGHARVVPPSQRFRPSRPSHIPRPITRREADPVNQQRKVQLVSGQTPASRSPIYGPVPSSPAHTPVDQYASYLRSVYTSKKWPTHSKWPPTATNKYVHLAVVKKEEVSKEQADEFTKSTIHGNIDDICKEKQAVDFTEIGKQEDGTPAKLILVEGAPGIGKTTFSWKVCRKWAKGKILQEYGLVVLLRLRDKRVQEIKCVADLFYHSDREIQNSVAKDIQRHYGKSVLLLFEGYDELPRNLQTQQSIFLDILHKEFLPHATILITSRPSATEFLHWKFRRQISQHIEILGFTKDDIKSYVDDAIKDEQVCRDFFQYLKCYPYIRGMMYVPLNAVIVTEVYKSSRQSPEKFIPTTMTELYTALTRSLLLRYLLSHSEYGQQKWTLKKFSDLPQKLYEQFNRICEVALKGMIEDKFVHKDLPHDFNTLDLMQSVPELYIEQGASISYNFFHLTLQEFLAAVSVSQQPIEKQIDFIERSISGVRPDIYSTPIASDTTSLDLSILPLPELDQHQHFIPIVPSHSHLMQLPLHLPTPHDHGMPDHPHLPFHQARLHIEMELHNSMGSEATFQNVLRFVAGLTKYENVPPDSLKPVVLEWHEEYVADISLNSLHWLFEARCTNIYCDLVRNITRLVYNSRDTSMAQFDCFVLGYALSHITFTGHWEIDMRGCDIDDECVEMLAGGVNFMSSTVLKCVRITKLVLSRNSITDRGAATLAEVLKENRTLQQLDVSINSFGNGGATALAEMLKENRTLQQLNVSFNSIGNGGATALAEMLRENRTLQQLHVSFNSIGDGGATALAEMLRENRTLQQMHVSSNSIGDGGVTALAEVLRENMTLQQLNVSFNSIGDGGAITLAEMLKKNRTLQQLNVSYNSIGDGGATALAEMLKENRTLQQLKVSSISIGDGGAIALAEILKENRTLQQLDISINSIGRGGATALAEMLKENRALEQLNISVNSIGDGGATALAEMLKENRTLQQLNISFNFIGDGGATTLVEMLKENRTLQQLDVRYNPIGDGGATALTEIQKQNNFVRVLY